MQNVVRLNEEQRGGLIALGRVGQALAHAKNRPFDALDYAKKTWKNATMVHEALHSMIDGVQRAAVAAGTFADSTWAGPLVLPQYISSAFAEYIAPLTIMGRLNTVDIPANVKFTRLDSGTSAGFVAEGAATPMTKAGFSTISLGIGKCVGIAAVTKEVANLSHPSAALVVSADLGRAMALSIDQAFLSPDAPASGVPAGIAYGATQYVSSGQTTAEVTADLLKLFQAFTNHGVPLGQSTLCLSEATALRWSTLQATTGGAPAFPLLSASGGSILGVRVLTTANLLASGNSPQLEIATLVHDQSIATADEGVALDQSQNALLQFLTNPTTGAAAGISLFQSDLVGLRATRYCSWVRRRDIGVASLTGIAV